MQLKNTHTNMKKERVIRTHQRHTKSGKVTTVRQHTAKYDATDKLKTTKKKGFGGELKNRETLGDIYEDYDFTEEDFKEWYEGTNSDADKKVANVLRKILGRKAYNELNDLAAGNYRKGGANSFFRKNVVSKTKVDDNKLMEKILGVESTGKVGNKVFGVGTAKLLDSHGNVIGVTLDTPNAIAHAMAKYKGIASAKGILGQEYREHYADRFDYAIKDKNLGAHLKMK